MPVYLDYNASAPVRSEVVEAMLPYFRDLHGNPSSTHYYGQRARAALEKARNSIANFVKVDPSEILFLSGGTEANNMVINSFAEEQEALIVTGITEHPATYNLVRKLEGFGTQIRIIPVDSDGLYNLDTLEKTINEAPVSLVSLMLANNETGAIQPIEKVVKMCHEKEIKVHIDAAQACGKIKVDFRKIGVDFATIAAHKMGGPIGIGALFIKSGNTLDRMFEGGAQEINRRPGTESVPLIVGFGEACHIANNKLAEEIQRITNLRNQMEESILENIPDAHFNSRNVDRLPNTSNMCFPGLSAEMLVIRLDLEGFAVSAGSACHSGRTEPSRTLTAMNLGDLAMSCIRVSLGPDTIEKDISEFSRTMVRVVNDIRATNNDLE